MGVFDHNAAYIWAIVALGLAVPIGLTAYVSLRARYTKQRLRRLEAGEQEPQA